MEGVVSLYSDGGVLGSSRSYVGGTWACVYVDADGTIVREESGTLKANTFGIGPSVTNNASEFFALLMGLSNLPDGWSGTVYCDSEITIGRFRNGWSLKGIPFRWAERMRYHTGRLGALSYVRLDGHPTAEQLRQQAELGEGVFGPGKRGNPVSRFNARADELCNLAKLQFNEEEIAS